MIEVAEDRAAKKSAREAEKAAKATTPKKAQAESKFEGATAGPQMDSYDKGNRAGKPSEMPTSPTEERDVENEVDDEPTFWMCGCPGTCA